MLVDTHTHLCDAKFDLDRSDAIHRAQQEGVLGLVEIADQRSEWEPAQSLSHHHGGQVYWTAGCHPYYADQVSDGLLKDLKKVSQDSRCVAVGEIGLDYFRSSVSREVQREGFGKILQVAFDLDKPVVIHCRDSSLENTDAQQDLLSGLQKADPSKGTSPILGVFHCFQGQLHTARQGIEMGFLIGIDGPVTYPRATSLQELVAALPLEKLVLETDSPYLPPQTHRGKRNEPSYLKSVAEKVAEIKNCSLEEVSAKTTANAEALYRVSFK